MAAFPALTTAGKDNLYISNTPFQSNNRCFEMVADGGKKKKPSAYPGITEDIIAEYEEDTLNKAMKALSTIEAALAAWDMSRDRPPEYEERFEKSRVLYNQLNAWAQKMAKLRGRKASYSDRLKLLTEFVDICRKNREVV